MAYDTKYGKVTVENEPGNPFGDDEPVFIIRGRDRSAVDAIRAYGSSASFEGASSEFVDTVRQRALEFQAWQDDHDELLKVPD